MSETSASPAEPALQRRLVWDAPLRVFHWLMVLCFAGAWLTAESERWQLVHVTLGYTLGALVLFRLAWGLAGTRHARFAAFVRGPGAVLAYLRSLGGPRPEHHVGHNPAGALAVIAVLGLAVVQVASGWAIYHDLGGHRLERLHETVAKLWLVLVVVHVAAVVISSRLHRENLVRAMVDGRKLAPAGEAISREWRALGALMLVAALGFWGWQYSRAPAPRAAVPADAADGTGPARTADAGSARHGHEAREGHGRHRDHDD